MSRKTRLRRKYVRVVKMGTKWNTYLQIDHQGFCVVEQTNCRRAQWFGTMLSKALARLVTNETPARPTQGDEKLP